jgi:hypothetical protein
METEIFGQLQTRSLGPKDAHGHCQYWCECSCGNGVLVRHHDLKRGAVRSCGCLRRKFSSHLGKQNRIHGLSKTPEYRSVASHWNFKYNKNGRCQQYYETLPFQSEWNPTEGGHFVDGARWILEHLGARPSSQHSLDIVEHHKGFVKGNLRWATKKEQRSNMRAFALTPDAFRREALRRGFYLVPICSNPAIIEELIPFADEQMCANCHKPVDGTIDLDLVYFKCSQCGCDQAIPKED